MSQLLIYSNMLNASYMGKTATLSPIPVKIDVLSGNLESFKKIIYIFLNFSICQND